MRKIIAILVGLIMLFSIPAFGEEIDFSEMNLDELTELYTKFIEEFQSRTEEKYGSSLIFEGVYTVGKDIKAGQYQFICIKNDTAAYLAFNNQDNTRAKEPIMVDSNTTLPCVFELEDSVDFVVFNCYGVLIPLELEKDQSWKP